MSPQALRVHLAEGHVIPAMPLALDASGRWSQRHQRALIRYYLDSGTGGLAVGVHSTQFAIRDPEHGLFQPVLQLCSEEIDDWLVRTRQSRRVFCKIAGICGATAQALREARFAHSTGYDAGLLSLTAMAPDATEDEVLDHCRAVSEIIPIIGFHLQTAVGGRAWPYSFWRGFADIPNAVAIKIAPFDRYKTWDVIRAVIDADRNDIILYTGNDDNIIVDLLTPFQHTAGRENTTRFIAGGLLGQWGVWTSKAVALLDAIKHARASQDRNPQWLTLNARLTDANAAIFDAAHNFSGCVPGINEILRRQGLLPSNRCLNPHESLSPGQSAELDRIAHCHPDFNDDAFVAENLAVWLDPGSG